MSDVIARCAHGMPHPASCVECMDEGPVTDIRRSMVESKPSRWTTATFEQSCMADARHTIRVGDQAGSIELVGWCCASCANGLPL